MQQLRHCFLAGFAVAPYTERDPVLFFSSSHSSPLPLPLLFSFCARISDRPQTQISIAISRS